MQHLPATPDLAHLKKQAKTLLRAARAGEPATLQRFTDALPAVRGASVASRELRLHDAHSVIAREYGFKSWPELRRYVEWKRTVGADRLTTWLGLVYEGHARERRVAVRLLREAPDLFTANPWVACAVGAEEPIRRAIAADAGWVNTAGGPMGMPPLAAVTHSRLIAEQDFAPRLLACAELLLTNGADANCAWTNPKWPDPPQSALYGAAGRTHNVAMTTLLLAAGANPDDGESLYHSVETSDSTCMRLLLRAGARVTGTNALGRVLDFDRLDDLDFMLQHGGDPNERPWVHHAILRGRSMDHIRALVDAGADVRTVDADGVSLYRCAQAHGRPDVVAMLVAAGVEEPLSEEEQFVGACARGDEAAARGIAARIPDILTRLSAKQLQTMPELAAIGNLIGVRTMLVLGWPLEVKSGWDATALNHAVFFGDAAITELLLAHGADWRARHAYRDNVLGTLSFASQDEVMDPPTPRDHVACARVLLAHGMPLPDGRQYTFSTDVTEFFDAQRGEAG